jgi:hypothetical protein
MNAAKASELRCIGVKRARMAGNIRRFAALVNCADEGPPRQRARRSPDAPLTFSGLSDYSMIFDIEGNKKRSGGPFLD